MAESYLQDAKRMLPCAAFVEGKYGLDGIYVGIPVIIGKEGVEKIIEIDLSKEEDVAFKESVNSVKSLIDACIKIDPLIEK